MGFNNIAERYVVIQTQCQITKLVPMAHHQIFI